MAEKGLPREDLYQEWYEWVIANLGNNNELASAAAGAAANASHQGKGFNASAEVAKATWNEAPKAGGPGETGRSVITNHGKERRDALIGVFGALGGNIFLFALCVVLLTLQAPETSLFVTAFVIGCALNVAVPIILAFVRPRIAVYVLLGDGIGLIFVGVFTLGLLLWIASLGVGALAVPF